MLLAINRASAPGQPRSGLGAAAHDAYERHRPESFPSAVADPLLAGEIPLHVHRVCRDLSQAQRAEASGVSQVMISQIKRGDRGGLRKTVGALARALERVPSYLEA